MFSASLLPALRLASESLPVAGTRGLSTDLQVCFANVTISVQGVGEWTVYAGFSNTMDADTHMLGHRGFLERFRATFDYHIGLFELEEPSQDCNIA